MSMTLKTRKVDNVVIIDMSGRLEIGEPALLLRQTIRRFIEDGSRNFVLNLADVSFIDSSGLGEMISAYTSITNKQGKVRLINLTTKVEGLLQITKLLTVFDRADSEAQAVQQLK